MKLFPCSVFRCVAFIVILLAFASSGFATTLNEGDTFTFNFDDAAIPGFTSPATALGVTFYNQRKIDLLDTGERVTFDFYETEGGALLKSYDITVAGFTAPDGISFNNGTLSELSPLATLWGGMSDGQGSVVITMITGSWTIESIAVGVDDSAGNKLVSCTNYLARCPEEGGIEVPAIPAPATFPLLATSLSVLGLISRYRKRGLDAP